MKVGHLSLCSLIFQKFVISSAKPSFWASWTGEGLVIAPAVILLLTSVAVGLEGEGTLSPLLCGPDLWVCLGKPM